MNVLSPDWPHTVGSLVTSGQLATNCCMARVSLVSTKQLAVTYCLCHVLLADTRFTGMTLELITAYCVCLV